MANYLNRPSIFEIATAYEDRNSGIIRPKKKDDIYGTFHKLSADEKKFIFNNPRMAYKFYDNSKKAKNDGRKFEGTTNGYGDAVRHCYWCALNQVSAGLNSPNAKKFGDAHENTSRNDIKAKAMDLHNNSVGYHLGNQAIINGWSEEELLNQVINAADNGTLKIIK